MLKKSHKNAAITLVIILGIVSFLADMTVEGAKSITGAFLALLGANAFIVGIVAGAGEFVGYALRLFSGYLVDKTANYWLFTFFGYACNLIGLPLLAFTGNWRTAAFLIILERVGKALRTPARDAMLSHASHSIGRGFGFGLHQTFDQLGAMLGPLIVTLVLFLKGSYRDGFAILFIPGFLAIVALIVASRIYPTPQDLETSQIASPTKNHTNATFWIYLLASASLAAGFADFPIIAYHFAKHAILSATLIPFSYAVGLGVSSASVLFFGKLYDRLGYVVLIITTVIAAFFPIFVFFGGTALAFFGMFLWGIGTGAQSSLLKAIIGDIIPKEKRGRAYGIYNACFGLACFIGSALMGFLYDISLFWLVVFSIFMQFLSVIIFLVAGIRRAK
ncbi:MAG: MFS transporter [Endomicrobiales bacterium]|nr:MFS transporter [Endomicrobiales bacterium]